MLVSAIIVLDHLDSFVTQTLIGHLNAAYIMTYNYGCLLKFVMNAVVLIKYYLDTLDSLSHIIAGIEKIYVNSQKYRMQRQWHCVSLLTAHNSFYLFIKQRIMSILS